MTKKKEINELILELESGLWDLFYHEDLPEEDKDIARNSISCLKGLVRNAVKRTAL